MRLSRVLLIFALLFAAYLVAGCARTAATPDDDRAPVAAAAPAARFVLVSLDPVRDTPGRMAAWAAESGLDSTRWTLLAGNDDAVREVAAALGVRYARLAGGEVAHSNLIAVLDARGAETHQQLGLGAWRETADAVTALTR